MDLTPLLFFWIAHFLLPSPLEPASVEDGIRFYNYGEAVATVTRTDDGFVLVPIDADWGPDWDLRVDPDGGMTLNGQPFDFADYYEGWDHPTTEASFMAFVCGSDLYTESCGLDLSEAEGTLSFWQRGGRAPVRLVWGEPSPVDIEVPSCRALPVTRALAEGGVDVTPLIRDPDDFTGWGFGHMSGLGVSERVSNDLAARAWSLELIDGQEVRVSLNTEQDTPLTALWVRPDGCLQDAMDRWQLGDEQFAQARVEIPGRYHVLVVADVSKGEVPLVMNIQDVALPDWGDDDFDWGDDFDWDDLFGDDAGPVGFPLELGIPEAGDLDPGTAQTTRERGQAVQEWALFLEAGQTITVDLMSEELDAYLILDGPNLQAPIEDDDGGVGLNSRIVYHSVLGGWYTVMATSFAVETGTYVLSVQEGAVPSADRELPDDLDPEGRTLEVNQRVEGQIDPVTAPLTLEGGQALKAWMLDLLPGQRVQITLRSPDFDAYLILKGGEWVGQLEDDDGAGGLDSRLVYTSPHGGIYWVVVTSFGVEAGRYTLEVLEMP